MDTATIQAIQEKVDLDRTSQPVTPSGRTPMGRRSPRTYDSILFESSNDRAADEATATPDFFIDLNCDQIVDAITAGKDDYNLRPFFYTSLHRVDAIQYRHEVMQDLETSAVLEHVRAFTKNMTEMRTHLGHFQKLYCKEHKQAWFLGAVETYCEAITAFAAGLSATTLKSRGFVGFQDYLTDYGGSARFMTLLSETTKLRADLATVNYCMLIKGDRFSVRKFADETDYSMDVEETFDKFKQNTAHDYRVRFSETGDMNHIEAKILEFVAKLHPEIFGPLNEYCVKNVTISTTPSPCSIGRYSSTSPISTIQPT